MTRGPWLKTGAILFIALCLGVFGAGGGRTPAVRAIAPAPISAGTAPGSARLTNVPIVDSTQMQTFNVTTGTQTFTVPATSTLTIQALGAVGGGGIGTGGNGATMQGDFSVCNISCALTSGETLTLLVGGSGGSLPSFSEAGGGGGGGSFVWTGVGATPTSSTLLIASGGGGGGDGNGSTGGPGLPGNSTAGGSAGNSRGGANGSGGAGGSAGGGSGISGAN